MAIVGIFQWVKFNALYTVRYGIVKKRNERDVVVGERVGRGFLPEKKGLAQIYTGRERG